MNRSKQADMGINTTVILLFALALASASLAQAQQQAKLPKIGWLAVRPASAASVIKSFQREFGKLGYVEGKNIVFEYRYAEGRLDRLPVLADELVRLKVDVLLTPTTPGALAAKNATKTIPIVFLEVTDPVGVGLVDSLARPGGNITGFTDIAAVLAGKRLELLKETVPKLSRVAVLWNPKSPGSEQSWKESQLAARELGLQLHSMEVSSADKYEIAFKEAIKARSDALVWMLSPFGSADQKHTVELPNKYRLPAIYTRRVVVENGGLMSYGPDPAESFRRVAVFVDKILKGAKPADIPVEQPTKFELVINLKTAKALGLTIPPVVMMRAEKVIKESAGINRHGVADERAAQERSSAPFWLRVMRLRSQGGG
jgi:putative tryptophan/tyrosine transport system substrate-binding protein